MGTRGMKKTKSRKQHGTHTHEGNQLSNHVRRAMENYFADLDGHDTANLYELFMAQVERPIFEVVLEQTHGNLGQASKILGLNRATLRSRMKKYDLD
jgi:Factor for inversion stimulation Fis, transcriptional activator